jgi:hypothetical protein
MLAAAPSVSYRFAAAQQPFILVPGANHGHTSNGIPNLDRGDIPAFTEYAVATEAFARAMAAFVTAHEGPSKSAKQAATDQLLLMVRQTAELVAPYFMASGKVSRRNVNVLSIACATFYCYCFCCCNIGDLVSFLVGVTVCPRLCSAPAVCRASFCGKGPPQLAYTTNKACYHLCAYGIVSAPALVSHPAGMGNPCAAWITGRQGGPESTASLDAPDTTHTSNQQQQHGHTPSSHAASSLQQSLLQGTRREAGVAVSAAMHPGVLQKAERFVAAAQLKLASTLPREVLGKLRVVVQTHTSVEVREQCYCSCSYRCLAHGHQTCAEFK